MIPIASPVHPVRTIVRDNTKSGWEGSAGWFHDEGREGTFPFSDSLFRKRKFSDQRPVFKYVAAVKVGRMKSVMSPEPNLKNAIRVAHPTGCGEVARCLGLHGTERVAGEEPIRALPLVMLKSVANPSGTGRAASRRVLDSHFLFFNLN